MAKRKAMKTVAFRVKRPQLAWMNARAKTMRVDRSALLRGILDAEMLRTAEEGGAAAVDTIRSRLVDGVPGAEATEMLGVGRG